jgi:predicted Zn-dependent peptidase
VAYAQFRTVPVGNARLHICSSPKFKTTLISALIQQELAPETVTKTALLPNVLQRGTSKNPSTLELKRKLDDLYGATLYGDVFKRGERHIIQFSMEIANERFLREQSPLLKEGLDFFSEVLLSPATENGAFNPSYVEAEKKNLRQRIESLKDDKIRYAAQRMVEAMCENEPYALFHYGRKEDLDGIDARNLFTYYQEVLDTCPVDFYCVGHVSVDEVAGWFEQRFADRFGMPRKTIASVSGSPEVKEEKVVVDRLDVTQGKLNIGLRTGVTAGDQDYPALLLYNGILGGFPHSKLFLNVREKASLAYYCSSRLESHKGLLMIQSGIEIANYDRAVDIIREQLEAMVQGEISDREMEQTKATLTNQLREQQDRSHEMMHFHYHSVLTGKERSLDSLLAEIERVQKDNIVRVAEKVKLDTIYFLRDRGGDGNAKN